MAEASTTRPLRSLYMYSPIASAIGTVQAIVNVPHELPGTACVDAGGQADAALAVGRQRRGLVGLGPVRPAAG